MPQTSVFTYCGFNFDIGNKNPQHLALFLETAPSLQDVVQFVQQIYKDVTVTAIPQVTIPKAHWVSKEEQEKIKQQTLEGSQFVPNVTFVEKPVVQPVLFPQLPELPKEQQQYSAMLEDMIMRDLVEEAQKKDAMQQTYHKQLLKQAQQVIKNLKQKEDQSRALALEETLANYEKIASEYAVGSPKRVEAQKNLEGLIRQVMNE